MVKRIDNRENDQLREIKVTRNYISHADGSVFIEMGKTRIVCTAIVEDKVPKFLAGKGMGWITAEYDMIPGSAPQRIIRAQTAGRINGRTHEIQRLIGRALRAIVDLSKIGERTIWIDCDVIEADGGTRTASITGSFIALFDCLSSMIDKKIINEMPVESFLAAVSVGIVDGEILVDLCFEEDSRAEVDMNVVMDSKDELIEVQSTAELKPFSREDFEKMLEKAIIAIREIIEIQKKILSSNLK
ncbi:MAG: ribonuclease PH [Candidatus Humimicrobiaceae bacterium]|jgi:ribonuclease PH|nr:ribonuclease PH [Actinomycetota bacterium]MDY0028082.1 ribonuclease PH [Candidatus Humimicrobiaceae bacterium]